MAEKTGYPAEMLEPDMQLDADLGIDSIKRVEILSAFQERSPTRRHQARAPGHAPDAPGTSPTSSTTAPGQPRPPEPRLALGQVQAVLLEVVAEKTGYPAEMLEPDMQLDADLGIDSIKRVEILSACRNGSPTRPSSSPSTSGRSGRWARSPNSLPAPTGRERRSSGRCDPAS